MQVADLSMTQTLKLRMVYSKWQKLISQYRAGERRQVNRRNMSVNEASRSRGGDSGTRNVSHGANVSFKNKNPRNFSGDP